MTEDFRRLIEKNANKIKRLARNYSFGNENNDLEQEIFLQIWRSYSSFSAQSSIDIQNQIMSATSNTQIYYRNLKRNFIIETTVSILAFLSVIAMMVFGDWLMAKILFEFSLNEHISGTGKVNNLMIFSFVLMAIYCITTPIKLWRSIKPDETLSWSLNDRVKSEIGRLTLQLHFWKKSPIWSFLPAIIIGVSFFWGLQFSLLGTWAPSIYLMAYFALLGLMTFGGFWLKKHMLQNEIEPLLQELQTLDTELVALNND
ncbi:MAG: hypothetical protein ABNH21_07660 [Glaciecola sp.]|jgi:hypothetical protein